MAEETAPASPPAEISAKKPSVFLRIRKLFLVVLGSAIVGFLCKQAVIWVGLTSGIVTICESKSANTTVLSICRLLLPLPPVPSPGPDPRPVTPEPRPPDPLWDQLSDLLDKTDNEQSYQADEAVRDFYNLEVKKSLAGSLSDAQLQLMKRAEQIVRKLADNDAHLKAMHDAERRKRLDTLHREAVLWRDRKTAEFAAFSQAMNDISDDDRQAFSDSEKSDWNTLSTATDLVKWPKVGLTAATQSTLPIKITSIDNSGSVADRLSKELRANLFDKFKIVDSYIDAALLIEIHDANQPPPEWTPRGVQQVTSFQVRVTWIGGKSALFGDKSISVAMYDEPTSRTAAAKNAAALFFDWVRQH